MDKALIDELNRVVTEVIQSALGHSFECTDEGQENATPPFHDSCVVVLGLGGETYQGQIVLGFSKMVRSILVKHVLKRDDSAETRQELVRRFLSELVNEIAGAYVASPLVKKEYQTLTLAVPIVWERGTGEPPRFTRSNGRSGKVVRGAVHIDTYFSVQMVKQYNVKLTRSSLLSFTLDDLQKD